MAPSIVVIASYLLIGIVAFWPDSGFSQRMFAGEADYDQAIWYLAWVPHALAHGLNPFFSNAILAPNGVNLGSNTASPLLGLATAPFAWLSPVARANLLMVLAMPASATAAFIVLRKWRVWVPAAALGGLIYGFSPYMVSQSLAHFYLTFEVLPPFLALTIASIVQRRGPPRRLGVQLGLLITAQYLIAPEVAATVALFIVAAVLCIAVRHPARISELVRALSVPVGISLLVTAVLLAYPIWMLTAGPQHFTGATWPAVNNYHNDLLSFVVPGPSQKVSLGMGSIGARLISGDIVETSGYIGVPLLILTGYLAWRSRRSPRTQLTMVLLLAAALLTLGPHLAVDGRLTSIPLPFMVLDHLPLFDDILPSRMCFEVGAFLAAAVAFGLDDMHRVPTRTITALGGWARTTALAGVTLAVLVVTQLPQWPYVTVPTPSVPAAVARAASTGDPVVLTYPYPTLWNMEPMIWQADDGFGFRLLGGYAFHPQPGISSPIFTPNVMRPPGLQQFLDANGSINPVYGPTLPVSPQLVATTRITLATYHVRTVIVDRSAGNSGLVMELFDDALGRPKLSLGQFSLWTDWHGIPKHQVFANPVTSVLLPANGRTLSGTVTLDAVTPGYLRVSNIAFILTDANHHINVIATARHTLGGWVAEWNTASVPSGTYTLQSVAHDSGGRSSYSKGITVTVHNQ